MRFTLAVALILLAVDWRQTLYIARHPDRYVEAGLAKRFIGEHPAPRAVHVYFAVWALLVASALFWHPILAANFLAAVVVIEAYVAYRNYAIGIGL